MIITCDLGAFRQASGGVGFASEQSGALQKEAICEGPWGSGDAVTHCPKVVVRRGFLILNPWDGLPADDPRSAHFAQPYEVVAA